MPLDIERVRAGLPERLVYWHPSLDSTMLEAKRLAAAGCPSGTAVVAEQQTAGVGRYQRPWHSEPESGLYVSVVLRFPFAQDIVPMATMALGLATADAIGKTTDIPCDLRWPNDVLAQDKKCAGILTEFDGSAIIAGIGINVNHTHFPDGLKEIATSLSIASGRAQSREKLLVELLPNIDSFCAILLKEGRQSILEMFSRASSYVSGRRVRVDQGDSTIEGTTAGLTPTGFLIVRDDRGNHNIVVAGGVRACS